MNDWVLPLDEARDRRDEIPDQHFVRILGWIRLAPKRTKCHEATMPNQNVGRMAYEDEKHIKQMFKLFCAFGFGGTFILCT